MIGLPVYSVLVKPLKVKWIEKIKRWKSAAVLICVEGPTNLKYSSSEKIKAVYVQLVTNSYPVCIR